MDIIAGSKLYSTKKYIEVGVTTNYYYLGHYLLVELRVMTV
jgi:hypothetical protein